MMIRAVLKSATACAVSWTGLDGLARASQRGPYPFIICYHRVVERLDADASALPAMEISVAMLEQHLDWLGRRFRIVSLNDLPARLVEVPDPRSLAIVTFDDGYSDVFHHAFPLLKRKGIPAGIFVVTDLVGSTELPVHERLYALLARAWPGWVSPRNDLSGLLGAAGLPEHLPNTVQDPFSATRFVLESLPQAEVLSVMDALADDESVVPAWSLALRPLSWEMVTTMRDAGMTIGSHSKTHAFLNNESEMRVREEAETSRRQLEQKLGGEIRCFSYPGGGFNSGIVQAVANAGYRYAFTTCRHWDPQNPLLTIPRKALWEKSCLDPFGRFSPSIMSCQASGTFDWASSCAHAGSRLRKEEFASES